MELFTEEQRLQLIENGRTNSPANPDYLQGKTTDHMPVVKWFNPAGGQTWLISELDPENPDIAFGLADMGFGCPELGSISVSEIQSLRIGPMGVRIERDLYFRPTKTLTQYAEEARKLGRIEA